MTTVDVGMQDGQLVVQPVLMPLIDQSALIMTPHERPVEGQVRSIRNGALEILAEYLPPDVDRRWSRGLFIEYAIDAGVYRLRTQLKNIARHAGTFTITLQSIDESTLLLVRRHVRAPLALPIRINIDGAWKRTKTMDVSGGGLRLPFDIGVQVGELVRLEIDRVSPYPVITATGHVVREAPEGGFGVAFSDIDDDHRAAIMSLCYAHRRAAARLGLTEPAEREAQERARSDRTRR